MLFSEMRLGFVVADKMEERKQSRFGLVVTAWIHCVV